jgi:hypothetical protein
MGERGQPRPGIEDGGIGQSAAALQMEGSCHEHSQL